MQQVLDLQLTYSFRSHMTDNGAGGVLVAGAFQAVRQRRRSSRRPLERFLRARTLDGQERRQQRNLAAPPRHESRRHAHDHRQTETNHYNEKCQENSNNPPVHNSLILDAREHNR